MRALYQRETWFLSLLYIVVSNASYHSNAHIHVTVLALPGEEIIDIWNNCVVGSYANCDILQNINKTY